MTKLRFKDHNTGKIFERPLAFYTTLEQIKTKVKPAKKDLVGVKYYTAAGQLAWVAGSEVLNFDELPNKI